MLRCGCPKKPIYDFPLLFGLCVSADAAAVFEFFPVLPLLSTLDAALAALLPVFSLAITVLHQAIPTSPFPLRSLTARLELEVEMNYPVMSHPYGGDDKRKLKKAADNNRVAVKVAHFLNAKSATIAPGDRENILSHSAAHLLGEDSETVRRIIMQYEGGSNGMFVYGPPHDEVT